MHTQKLDIAMLSLHSSPMGPIGTQDTGGMSVYVRELSRWLGARGHHIDIFTCVGDGAPEVELSPRVRLIQLVHLGGRLGKGPSKADLPARLPRVFEALDSYKRSHRRHYSIIHSHYWLSGVVGCMAREQWSCPHVTTFHTLAARKNRESSMENEPDLRLASERRITDRADRIIVPVRDEGRFIEETYGAPRSKIHIIPGGVDLERFRPMDRCAARKQLDLPEEAFLILYVGRFAPLKRVDRLVSALARLRSQGRQVQLVLVGGDDPGTASRQALEAAAGRFLLEDAVHFAGRVAQEALPAYYNAADVMVLPSDYESFGLVLLEALACGTPVAATRVGVAPHIVEEGINGTLLASNRVCDLVSGIAGMIETKRAAADRLRSTVTPYGWPGIADAVVDVYVSVNANGTDPAVTEPI
jgi:D-inositol-3-phosphate glycosyltransferase